MANALIFRQLFDTAGSSTYTYLLADPMSKAAILIDPVLEMVDRDLTTVDELGLNLLYVLNTHAHADHVTGTGEIKRRRGDVKSVVSAASTARADVLVAPGDKVTFGSRHISVLATPGHTAGCVSYLLDDSTMVFTGDALLIRACGRTDFQGGSATTLYDSVHSQLFTLPPACVVYPAHDYKGRMLTTVDEESRLNPRLTKTKEEFVAIMDGLGLAYPKKFDISVPRNLICDYVE